MSRMSHAASACCAVALLGSAALSAQAPSPTPLPAAPPDAAALSMKAISRLFAQAGADVGRGLRQKASMPRLEPLHICGIKVLRPNPTIDPKFATPLRDTRTVFAIRTLPVLCP